ncbi:MAG: 2-hydroxyacyl-CoA dehydratase family protein [Clostridium sp.]|uniref:2-hydroxyacyl-CoA dehydratase family protein n=1 Tax=Clostridium sp. TaxID=1506 RepID=UPI003D6DA3A0
MKDLKNLLYLENLLQDSNNDLVRIAKEKGEIAIGNVCYQIPEVLLNLPGCFSVRMRAPNTTSMEMGTYYMTSLTCEYCRAMLERALEGSYQFLDCIFDPASCSQLADCMENIEELGLGNGEKFFVQHVDTPMKDDENGISHMTHMSRVRVLDKLREVFGIDTSDDALRKSVKLHNEVCGLITEMGQYRKLEKPTITGYEFAVFTLASYCCPKDLILPCLRETVEELKTRASDEKNPYRVRVVVAGSEIDDPTFIKLIEDSGAYVAADRFCFGSFPGRQQIILNDEEDVLTQICRKNVTECQCPRYMNTSKINGRKEYLDKLAGEYKADGIIFQQMNFCNFWGYERAGATHIMTQEYHWPVLSVDRPYVVGNSGQLRTRIQAFVERIELKKLQGGND